MARQIPLTQNQVAIVDDDDYEWLSQWNWHAKNENGHWYAMRADYSGPRQRTVRMHRAIMEAPRNKWVDHVNGDGLDNRRENLRICLPRQNCYNRSNTKRSASRFKGVTPGWKPGLWRAQIVHDGELIYLGLFQSQRAAASAYDAAAKEHFGRFAKLNLAE